MSGGKNNRRDYKPSDFMPEDMSEENTRRSFGDHLRVVERTILLVMIITAIVYSLTWLHVQGYVFQDLTHTATPVETTVTP